MPGRSPAVVNIRVLIKTFFGVLEVAISEPGAASVIGFRGATSSVVSVSWCQRHRLLNAEERDAEGVEGTGNGEEVFPPAD